MEDFDAALYEKAMKEKSMQENVHANTLKLDTPVGYFSVEADKTELPFSVKLNCQNSPYEVVNDSNRTIGNICTDTNYRIVINTNNLQLGKEYVIRFTPNTKCKWEYCDSDEHTVCYNTIIGDWIVGIGAYDPNDQDKETQAWKYSEKMGFLEKNIATPPLEYDETKFRQYTVDPLKTLDGFCFKLLDYSKDTIVFDVAWIHIGEYPVIEYEGALGLWLC